LESDLKVQKKVKVNLTPEEIEKEKEGAKAKIE
jgi:hypothetical protein